MEVVSQVGVRVLQLEGIASGRQKQHPRNTTRNASAGAKGALFRSPPISMADISEKMLEIQENMAEIAPSAIREHF
jgi:hypothetical protein